MGRLDRLFAETHLPCAFEAANSGTFRAEPLIVGFEESEVICVIRLIGK